MTTLTRERLLANLPEASEMLRRQDLEAIFARLDEEWRELKEFLKEWVQSDLRKESESQAHLTRLSEALQEDADTNETAASPPLADNKMNFAVSPLEAEAIMAQVGKSDQETKILERLDRVERQCHRLTIRVSLLGILTCTLIFGSMVFSTDHLRRNLMSGGNTLVQIARGITLTSPSREPTPLPAAKAIPAQSASQESLTITNNLEEPAIPVVKYVGSITSNKYHYPNCRWAKTIIPRKVRGFHSVDEAQKAGYIRCPVCQPPLTDNPE